MSGRFQILSLDGGGIRGLFTSAVLAAFEADLRTRLIDHFDLIVGTSTGGIIALGLGLGLSPATMVEFYREHGPTIFGRSKGSALLRGLFGPRYSARPLESALKDAFGTKLLGCSTKRLVIPSYNLGADDVYLFRTPHAEKLRRDYKVPAWQVALATSAAPTYFPAHLGVDGLRLIDGGLWANNPALVGVVEATCTLGVPRDEVFVLSLGTFDGVASRKKALDKGGFVRWASAAPHVLMRAQAKAVTNQVKLLLEKRQQILRIDPPVAEKDISLDRMAATDLIAQASHHSRHFTDDVAKGFAGHVSVPYEPLYGKKVGG